MVIKIKSIIFVLIFIFLVSPCSFARDVLSKDDNNAIRKLSRGFANVITAPIQLFETFKEINDNDGPIAAITYGPILGLVNGIDRLGVGLGEIFTFACPGPKKDYKPVLDNPEFFNQDFKFKNNMNMNKDTI